MFEVNVLWSVIHRSDRWQPDTRACTRERTGQAVVGHCPPPVYHLIGVKIQVVGVVAQEAAADNLARQEMPFVGLNGSEILLSNSGGVFDFCQWDAGAFAAIAQNCA